MTYWTVAYRKTHANRFERVGGIALDWDAATELAIEVHEALGDGYEVYYLPNRQAELDGFVFPEDIGTVLVESGKRVPIKETGVLPKGVHVEGCVRPAKKVRGMGYVQKELLDVLKSHEGVWYPGCGWYWGNVSSTKRILDSLVRRGLVAATDSVIPRTGESVTTYTLVEA